MMRKWKQITVGLIVFLFASVWTVIAQEAKLEEVVTLIKQHGYEQALQRLDALSVDLARTSARYHILMGDANIGLEKYDAAEGNYQQALKIDAKNMQAYQHLADLYITKKDYGKAIEQIGKAISKEKKDKKTIFDLQLVLAKTFVEADSVDQAWKILLELQGKDEKNSTINEMLGDVYIKKRIQDNALIYYKKAEELDANNVSVKHKIAKVHVRLKQWTEAVDKYNEIIGRDSTYVSAYLEVGNILHSAGKFGNAVFYYEKFLKYDQKNLSAYRNCAQDYLDIRKYDEAYQIANAGLQHFANDPYLKRTKAAGAYKKDQHQEALDIYTTLPDSVVGGEELFTMGKCYLGVKNTPKAIEYLKKAATIDPSIKNVHMEIGNACLKDKNFPCAVEEYKQVLVEDPKAVNAYYFMGLAYFQQKNFTDAIQALSQGVALKSDFIPMRFWYANSLNSADMQDSAMVQYQTIIQQIQSNAEFEAKYKNENYESHRTIGTSHLIKKNYPEAVKYLKTAVTINPDKPDGHHMLGNAYVGTQNYEAAKTELRQAIKLDPKNEDIKKFLQSLEAASAGAPK